MLTCSWNLPACIGLPVSRGLGQDRMGLAKIGEGAATLGRMIGLSGTSYSALRTRSCQSGVSAGSAAFPGIFVSTTAAASGTGGPVEQKQRQDLPLSGQMDWRTITCNATPRRSRSTTSSGPGRPSVTLAAAKTTAASQPSGRGGTAPRGHTGRQENSTPSTRPSLNGLTTARGQQIRLMLPITRLLIPWRAAMQDHRPTILHGCGTSSARRSTTKRAYGKPTPWRSWPPSRLVSTGSTIKSEGLGALRFRDKGMERGLWDANLRVCRLLRHTRARCVLP